MKRIIKAALLASVALAPAILMPVGNIAHAQTAVRNYSIAPQNLESALRQFASQSGQDVVFDPKLVAGRKSEGLQGSYEAREALRLLLTRTDLKIFSTSAGFALRGAAGNAPVGAVDDQTASSREDGSSATVSGQVVDELTGSSLKGALVEIVGTDRSTSTDDLGTFRFSSLAPGSYDIRINYLGYVQTIATLEVRRGAEPMRIAMRGGSKGAEIVVYGRRSARAQSLNEERTAENSTTVLASDFLGQFDGDTISEAMRRAPGVAFEQDPVTGDGTNVIIRGLAPDLNTVTFNGLRLPEGSGTERSASLGNILTDSIAKITINKTLLPSHDSSGTGGLIEIETKGPLDRTRRFADFSLSGSRKGAGFRDGLLASGTVSGTFGKEQNLGLSLSVQYRKQDIKRISYASPIDASGLKYLPLNSEGAPVTQLLFLDPRTKFPFEAGVDDLFPGGITNSFNGASTSNLTISASGQWKIAEHTNLRLDYSRAKERQDSFTRNISVDVSQQFELMPVDELGGEIRAVRVAEDVLAQYGQPGVVASSSQSATVNKNRTDTTQSLSFRGETNLGGWKFDYTLGFATGQTVEPFFGYLNAQSGFLNIREFLLPEALSNVTSTGRIISAFPIRSGRGFPLPLLTQAGFDAFDETARFSSAGVSRGTSGENDRFTADISTRYDLNRGILKYVEAGIFHETARFSNRPNARDESFQVYPADFSNRPQLIDLGLGFTAESLKDIGMNGGFSVFDEHDVGQFLWDLGAIAAANPLLGVDPYTASDPRLQKTFTKESNTSAYVQIGLNARKLEVVGGVRLDRIELQARNFTGAYFLDENFVSDPEFEERSKRLFDQKVTQTTILPRVAATYRHSENTLLRAGFAMTVARPRIQDLSNQSRVSLYLVPFFGPNDDQPGLFVQQGNPDLKPALTKNFDVSAEHYFSDAGQVKFSLFYKKTENLLEQTSEIGVDSLDGVELPDDPRFTNLPANIFIEVRKPVNTPEPASIWGIEAAVEKQFTFLPGLWGGFGVFANYTYTDSSKTQPIIYYDPVTFGQLTARIKGVPFSGSPKHSATAAITYNKYGIDATLAYTTQARRLLAFNSFNLNEYNERDSSLDFRFEYRFKRGKSKSRLWIEASDLLKGTGDPDVETSVGGNGAPKFFTGGNFYGGRSINIGASISFN